MVAVPYLVIVSGAVLGVLVGGWGGWILFVVALAVAVGLFYDRKARLFR